MRNHRGELVIKGNPELGTYIAIANQTHTCSFCGGEIQPGEEFSEDFVTKCHKDNCKPRVRS